MTKDSLGVAQYWRTTDYLGLKADIKHEKAKRDGEPPRTPISNYVNRETGFYISQFKSPRSAPTPPIDTTKTLIRQDD